MSKEIILSYYEESKGDYYPSEGYTERETKLCFLVNQLFDLTTYDNEMSITWGEDIFEVLKVIKDRKTFEYIKSKDKYYNYIRVCNLIESWLGWGTSIRGAWLDTYNGEFCFFRYGEDSGDVSIKITEEFINWFVEWLEVE